MLRAIALAAIVLVAFVHAGDYGEPHPVPGSFILSSLAPQAAAPAGASAFVRMDIAADGTQSLVVRLLALPAGSYDVWRNTFGSSDELLGTVEIGADGTGLLNVEPSPFSAFFEWFEFQIGLSIRQDSTVLFSGQLDSPGGDVLLDDDVHCANAIRLVAVGDDLDARGDFSYHSSFGNEGIRVRLERLAPGPYVVLLDGKAELLLDADAKGHAQLREHLPVQAGGGSLTVYPLGKLVQVRNLAGEIVLEGQLPWDLYEQYSQGLDKQRPASTGLGAADGLKLDLLRAGSSGDGSLQRGWIEWDRDAAGSASISVRILGQDFVPFVPYEIFVGDTLVGHVGVSFADDPLFASFGVGPEIDLRLQRVDVRKDGHPGLSVVFPRSVPAALGSYRPELRKPKRLRLDLLDPGTDLDATGRLDWRKSKAHEQLRLVVRDLPAGSYDVALDGLVVAVAALVVAEDGGEATQLFSTDGALPGSLPLNFAVIGELQIRATGTATEYLRQTLEH